MPRVVLAQHLIGCPPAAFGHRKPTRSIAISRLPMEAEDGIDSPEPATSRGKAMPKTAKTAHGMISGMSPSVRPGRFVFVATQDKSLETQLLPRAISIFREAEGVSLLVPVDDAERAGFDVSLPMCCITLNVYSSLEGVGLTAAVSGALAKEGIPCNMIAALRHDHVFVPEHLCDRAMRVLEALQGSTAR